MNQTQGVVVSVRILTKARKRLSCNQKIPKFIINTNVSKDKVPYCLIEELTHQLTKALGKTAQYLVLQISTDQLLSFHGSKDPCTMCFLYSIGNIGDQENKDYSKLLCDLLNKHPKNTCRQIYISYFDTSAATVGWNHTTFA
ncbi:macrophage migration inhibitory factor-like [Dermochelys coriacea]|uniref:macrophage migration inhibitory factor-like n=1 Tax=Dermochelys coriacea TaxID=27794 RepID=UPI001CA9B700|nr:macrophage migration inhibitory factor-like [Dermochelys coriacea]